MPARPFRYHVYHRSSFDKLPDWSDAPVTVRRLGAGGTQVKRMYSLKKDMDTLRAMGAAKGIVDAGLVTLGQSHDGRELWVLKVGNGSSHKVLFTGCHHAREWISVEIPYLVAEHLIENHPAAGQTSLTPKEKRIKHLLLNRQIWFVPLANPDGHHHTMAVPKGNRLWRPNRRTYVRPAGSVVRPGPVTVRWKKASYTGVDINRNYATANWGTETFEGGAVKTSVNPEDSGAHSIWCGVSASGEAETALLDALITAEGFRSSITYHSFSQLLLFPDPATGDPYLQWVGGGLRDLINNGKAPGHANEYTYQSSSALYPTSGSAMVFSYEKSPGRPTFTPELRPAQGAAEHEVFSGLPESEIEPTFKENLGAALALINCAGHDAEAASHTVTASTAAPPAKAQMVRHCWEIFRGWTP